VDGPSHARLAHLTAQGPRQVGLGRGALAPDARLRRRAGEREDLGAQVLDLSAEEVDLGRPRAFGSPLPFGAVWDGNEEQRGRPGILSLLAGASASDAVGAIVTKEGPGALARSLDWLGSRRADLMGFRQITWEDDPWARGGYAFFDPAFDPSLRAWLARPCGRLFFAGEHTSLHWQGYMNGAVESGRRAAAEVAAVHACESAKRP